MSDTSLPDVDNIGHEHPDITGGWLRPAVFGAMDGLVSNFALIMGVAGGTAASVASGGSTQPIVLAGLAGLVAGAFSMAAGEYTSVKSQMEFALDQIEVERGEIERNADAEEAELAAMFVGQGVEEATAREVADQVHRDPEAAIKLHTLLEMGIDTDDLASPMLAAISSFFAFGVGAIIPLLPYLLGVVSPVIPIVVSLVGLFLFGALVTRITSVPWWFGGTRQLLLGSLAAGVTYLVGMWIGG